MTLFSKLLVGSAVVGMAAVATPAAAQYYPQQPYYPQSQPNPGYAQPGGIVGQVINQVLGGGRYGAYGQGNDRVAVDQCARAAEVRVSQDNRRGVYGRWNQGYGQQGNGYQGYNQAYGQAQVVGITGVQRVRSGLRVTGLIDTRMRANLGGYGQYNQYGQAYPGYPNQAYPNQAYPNQGFPKQGYGQQHYPAYDARLADLSFNCRVDSRGRIADLDIRRTNARRGV